MTPLAACVLSPVLGTDVWSLGDPAAISDAFTAAADRTRERSRDLVGVYGKLGDMVRGSDLEIAVSPVLGRIVIAARPLDDRYHPAVVIEFCAILAGQCFEDLLQRPVPTRLFRGAVAYGPGDLSGGRLIGPAFEDADACAMRTHGAFLWLAPSALAVYSSGSIASTILGDCDIPLTGGDHLPSKAVRLRLDASAAACFKDKAAMPCGVDGAVAQAHSLRHLAWLGTRR
ncbi:MAG: hypothetical protein J0M02_08355 [Planctomycetes bacterium]|nr:hypothetical protein [Planctomycetota bacterium]